MQGLIESLHYRACIASLMIIVNLIRAVGEIADASYHETWMGLWVLAEVSIGVSIIGTFSLPKFVEAEGPKLRGVFSRLTRPLASQPRFGIPMQWKHDAIVASQELQPDDAFTKIEHSSENDLVASTNDDHDVEGRPSYEDGFNC